MRSLGLVALLILPALAGWLPVESLTVTPTIPDSTAPAFGHCVGADADGNLHVVWRSESNNVAVVRYRRWDALSGEWEVEQTISDSGRSSRVPSLAVDDSGNVHVVWWSAGRDTSIRYRRRGGLSGEWDDIETVTSGDVTLPVVAACSPNLVGVTYGMHLSLTQYVPSFQLRLNGRWQARETVSTTSNIPRGSPALAADAEGRFAAVWRESPAGDRRLVFRERNGGEWGQTDTLRRSGLSDTCSVVLRPGGADAIAMRQLTPTSKYFLLWRIREARPPDTVQLQWPYTNRHPASLAIDELGCLHAAWSAGTATVQPKVFYSRSDTSGAVWEQPFQPDSGGYAHGNPSVSCGPNGGVQVVWTDEAVRNAPTDIRLRRFVERAVDVAAGRVVAPAGVVDSGEWVLPAAWVRNNGDSTERGVPVWLAVGSSTVPCVAESVPAGDSVLVVGESLQMVGRGVVPVVCSTRVAGDVNRSNDVWRGLVRIRVADVVAAGWNAPGDSLADTLLVPEVVVRHAGTDSTDIVAFVTIVPDYSDSTVMRLAPGRDSSVRFAPWPAVPGAHVARCSVWCAGDRHPENDTLSRRFVVVHHDVGVERILLPAETVELGEAVRPQVAVRNRGSVAERFAVRLRVGAGFEDTAVVSALEPESVATVQFREWVASAPGAVAVWCATLLAGDIRPGDDTLGSATFVRLRDAAARGVVRPEGVIGHGPVEPAALVANDGNVALDARATFVITADGQEAYRAETSAALAAGEERELVFDAWEAESGGDYRALVQVTAAGDRRPENDSASSSFRVARVDASAVRLVGPVGRVEAGSLLPEVVVRNRGDDAADVRVGFAATDDAGRVACRESARVNLPAQVEQSVVLPAWAAQPGRYCVEAFASAVGDEFAANDSLGDTLRVDVRASRRWRELAPVPPGPRNRPVRAGGCVAALGDGVVALKGAHTTEFYRYFVAGDSWLRLADRTTPKVSRGAALCWDGGDRVYAVRGGGTREFWSYSLAGDSWSRLPDLPEFTPSVRHGAGLAFVAGDTDRVFLVKGSRTLDFLVYWVGQRQWHARRPLPAGPRGRTAGHGTALVAAAPWLWCIKGGTDEFYEYRPDRDSWVALPPVPMFEDTGRARKFRHGAAIAPVAGRWLYALKGGRSNEVWRYDSWLHQWKRDDDVPAGAAMRRAGAGAGLAAVDGKLYALKGNRAREFWCCDSASTPPSAPGRAAGPALELVEPARSVVRVTRAGLKLALAAGAGEAVVFDAAGRVRARLRPAGGREVTLPGRGVFFVRLDSGATTVTLKVVRP